MKDRRWYLRVQACASILVWGAASPFAVSLQNLSRSGARIARRPDSPWDLASTPVGSTLNLALQLGARSFEKVSGKVVQSDSEGVSLCFDEILEGRLFESIALRNLVESAARV
jgi:hypothetical protein